MIAPCWVVSNDLALITHGTNVSFHLFRTAYYRETEGHILQIYSGITCGRVLNGELYTQRLQKLIYL